MELMDFFAEYATDPKVELKGAPVPINGVTFYIARSGNRAYGKLLQELVGKHEAVLDQKDEAADAKSDEIMVEVLSKTILVGWDGELNFGGEMLKYSAANAAKLLALKDFRIMIIRHSENREHFRVAKLQEKVKN